MIHSIHSINLIHTIHNDNGKIYSIKKLLPNGPNIELLNGNKNYLNYENYVMPYNSNFINFINNKYSSYFLEKGKLIDKGINEPLKYQEFVKEYMKYGTPYKGLLINHGLGSGKTRSCVMISETFRAAGIPILYIGPASLKNNYIKELFKWGNNDIKFDDNNDYNYKEKLYKRNIIDKYYTFISSNSSNLLSQLANIGIGYPNYYDNISNKGVADFLNKNPKMKLNYPKNMLIILEEVHNINQKFSSKSSKSTKKLYELLKNSIDCKIIALSATPIINKPFEICTLLNVLKGPLIDGSTILPETEEEFNELYLDDDNKIINKYDLQVKMMGLISYYKGIISDKDKYPDLIHVDINYIPMSAEQNIIHDYFLELDLKNYLNNEENLNNISLLELLKKVEEKEKLYGVPTNSYRIYSRTICNYVWKIKENDYDKPNMNILHHILEFKNINFKNPESFYVLFLKDQKNIDINNIKDLINNFPFDKNIKFNYYDYIMNEQSSVNIIKDIFTCAVLFTYCNVLRTPLVLNTNNSSVLKIKSKFNINPILKYLTDKDIDKIYDIIKSRNQKIEDVINKMVLDADNYFSLEALKKHSPKMLEIYNNIINGLGKIELSNNYNSNTILINGGDEAEADDSEIDENPIFDIDEEENYKENIDIDMLYENNNNKSNKIDAQLLFLTNDNILYPKNEKHIKMDSYELFEEFKNIDNKNFLNSLLDTLNKYIIYTPTFNIYKNKYFIKNNNNYGIALMYYRNYLNNKPIENIPILNNIEIINFDPIYMTKKVIGGPAFVYSEFNKAEGINIFSKVLDHNGFNKLNIEEFDNDDYTLSEDDFAPRYTIISGDIDMEIRSKIIKLFNNPINKHGQLIRVILGTSAASEGIDLKYIRQVHILEPFWHNVKIEQVIGRARRLKSHSLLNPDERNIYVYRYISKSNSGVLSTDEYLYNLSNKKSIMINEIYDLLQSISIDCSLNYNQNNTNIQCLKFPENKINEQTFLLKSEIEENNNLKKNIEKTIVKQHLKAIKNKDESISCYYKVITDFKTELPAESKLYKIKNDPKFREYAGTKKKLFPLYNNQAINGIFIIISYGYMTPNNTIIKFPISAIDN